MKISKKVWVNTSVVAIAAAMLAMGIVSQKTTAAPEFTLKFASVAPANTPWSKQLKALKKHIEKESGGRIKVKASLGGALGGEKALVRRTASGSVQAFAGSVAALGTKVPELSVIESPYLFASTKEADKALDSKAVKDIVKTATAKRGFVFGFWGENGFRSWFTKGKVIKKPADMKGLRMRAQESKVHLTTYKALGAQPVSIDVTNVLTSLQNDVVDGFDNTPLFAFATSWYQAAKYLILSEHSYQPGIVAYSKKWFDTLPADLQKILTDVPTKIISMGRTKVRKMDPAFVSNLKRAGITVYKPSAAEKAAFKKKTAGVAAKTAAKAGANGKALLKAIKANK